MNLEFFIAKRYLISKHKLNFITIISIISTLGVTLGVAALIVVLSVFNGFGDLVTSILVNFDPHVRITAVSEEAYEGSVKIAHHLKSIKNIKSFYPFVEGKCIIKNEDIISIVDLKGMDYSTNDDLWGVKSNVKLGTVETNPNGILIGINLASKLHTVIGDTVTITSFNNISKSALTYSLPPTKTFVIEGIFESNNNDYDMLYVFTSLNSAQNLLGMKNKIQGFEVRLSDLNKAEEVKKELISKIDHTLFSVQNWYDLHKDLYSMMQIERWAAYIILSLIIAVAVFNVLGSLSMSVIEKKKDIGILRSMGTKDQSILRIFMFEGLLIGLIGTITGIIVGSVIIWLQVQYNFYPLDPTKYIIDALPVRIRISDYFAIAGMSLLLSFLAALYPAKRAVKVSALEAIKWE